MTDTPERPEQPRPDGPVGPPDHGPWPGPPPTPGVVPLRPLELGDLLGGAWRCIRVNPAATLGTAVLGLAVVGAVQVIAQAALRPSMRTLSPQAVVDYLVATSTATGLTVAVSIVVGAVLSGALLVVLRRALIGHTSSPGDAWRGARSKIGGLIGVGLLIGLVAVVVLVVGFGLAVGVAVAARGAVLAIVAAVVIGLATYVLLIYVAILLVFAPSAYVMEDVGVLAALGRSRVLVRGTWWRTFGVLLLVGVVYGVVVAVVTVPIGVVGGMSGSSPPGGAGVIPGPSLTVTALTALATVVVGSVGVPVIAGVTGLLYTDRRIRTERFDLELAARAAGQPGPGEPW